MAKRTLTRCEISWSVRLKRWVWSDPDGGGLFTSAGRTKTQFIKWIVATLRDRVAAGAYGFSLRITKKDGSYQEERTIPRSRDPHRSKG